MRIGPWEFRRRKEPAVRFFGELAKVTIEPGDIFILMTEQQVSVDMVDRLEQIWRERVGADVRLMIVGDGMKLAAVSLNREAFDRAKTATEQAAEAAVRELLS